ncbi:MAG: membrane AbrB-like protein [Hyphomonas sp.]
MSTGLQSDSSLAAQAFNALKALSVGGVGGAAFWGLSLPLPWMLGAVTFTAMAVAFGGRPSMPVAVRDVSRPVIGVLAGSAFTPAILTQAASWWPAIMLILSYTLATLVIGFFYYRSVARFDRVTALFASAPGGLSELTLLAADYGADVRGLVLLHSIRIVLAVLILPLIVVLITGADLSGAPSAAQDHGVGGALLDWLILIGCGVAGYALGKLLRLPGGVMIGALVISAIVHIVGLTSFAPPPWLVIVVQVVIGSAAGARFVGTTRTQLLYFAVHGFGFGLCLLAMAAGFAWIGSLVLPQPYVALLLAISPGGIAEMTIITYAIGLETAFVVTCQIIRIFSVHIITPFLAGFAVVDRR